MYLPTDSFPSKKKQTGTDVQRLSMTDLEVLLSSSERMRSKQRGRRGVNKECICCVRINGPELIPDMWRKLKLKQGMVLLSQCRALMCSLDMKE